VRYTHSLPENVLRRKTGKSKAVLKNTFLLKSVIKQQVRKKTGNVLGKGFFL
jgi:hypothetical protein